jgi:hypothetical protein
MAGMFRLIRCVAVIGSNMPCLFPMSVAQSKKRNPKTGKFHIIFRPNWESYDLRDYYDHATLPCGRCIECRLNYSRQWAIRCMHEASLYDDNCFITLTFDEECLPPDKSLHVEYYQKFMKRLRKRFKGSTAVFDEKTGKTSYPIRFFHCGEYGEEYGRPHYHACLFNFDFPDKKFKVTRNGNRVYESRILSELWPYGFHEIGDVTFESAAYVARYVCKKVTGDKAKEHYGDKKPEYTTMSRRPGIGARWHEKFKGETFFRDSVIVRGREMKPPKYYGNRYELTNPEEFERIRKKRVAFVKKKDENLGITKILSREKISKQKLERLKRSHE